MFDWLRRIFMVKVVEPEGGHYEEYDGVKHWVPAGYYWIWRWKVE